MRILMLTTLAFLLNYMGGCATIINGSTQEVSVSSDPPGARVTADGNPIGVTPIVLDLKRKSNHIVTISMDGYHTEQVSVVKVMSGAVAGNILAGGFIGWGVDAASGAQYKLKPDTVAVQLRRLGPGESDQEQSSAITVEERLRQLDRLRRDGILTEDEFIQAKASILDEFADSAVVPKAQTLPPSSARATPAPARDSRPNPASPTDAEWLIAPVEQP